MFSKAVECWCVKMSICGIKGKRVPFLVSQIFLTGKEEFESDTANQKMRCFQIREILKKKSKKF